MVLDEHRRCRVQHRADAVWAQEHGHVETESATRIRVVLEPSMHGADDCPTLAERRPKRHVIALRERHAHDAGWRCDVGGELVGTVEPGDNRTGRCRRHASAAADVTSESAFRVHDRLQATGQNELMATARFGVAGDEDVGRDAVCREPSVEQLGPRLGVARGCVFQAGTSHGVHDDAARRVVASSLDSQPRR